MPTSGFTSAPSFLAHGVGGARCWRWLLLGVVALDATAACLCAAAPPTLATSPSPGSEDDKQNLREAGIALDTEALLRFVERAVGKPLPPARVKTLITQLGDDSLEKREAASEELAAAGPTVLDALRAAAKSEDAETATRARRLLKGAESGVGLAPRAARVLLREAKPGTVRRLLALPQAGRVSWLQDAKLLAVEGEANGLGSGGPRRELMAALGHPDPATRDGVLRVLAETPGGGSFGDLVRLTWSENDWARAGAASLFWQHKDKTEEGFKHLGRLLKDKAPLVRYEAAQSLRSFRAAEGMAKALIGALEDGARVSEYRGESVASVAADSLLFVTDESAEEALKALIPHLRSSDRELARKAALSLGQLGGRSDRLAGLALPRLVKLLESSDAPAKRASAFALGSLRHRGRPAQAALLRALEAAQPDKSEEGRLLARVLLYTLRDIGPTAEAAPLLARILSSETAPPQQRAIAAQALGAVNKLPAIAITALEMGAKAEDDTVRGFCLEALKTIKR